MVKKRKRKPPTDGDGMGVVEGRRMQNTHQADHSQMYKMCAFL
jgi:hypothetical protein